MICGDRIIRVVKRSQSPGSRLAGPVSLVPVPVRLALRFSPTLPADGESHQEQRPLFTRSLKMSVYFQTYLLHRRIHPRVVDLSLFASSDSSAIVPPDLDLQC